MPWDERGRLKAGKTSWTQESGTKKWWRERKHKNSDASWSLMQSQSKENGKYVIFHDLWPQGLVWPMKVWIINRYSWFQHYSLPDFEMRVLQKIWWSFEPLLHELDKWLDLSIKSDLGFVTCNMQPLLGLSWICILWAASSPLPGRGKWDSLSPAPPRG